MASNELAAILARRRAKAGGADEMPAIEKSSDASSSAAPSAANGGSEAPAAAPAAPRMSIAERIARLKQQGAEAAAKEAQPVVPAALYASRPASSPTYESNTDTTTESVQALFPGGATETVADTAAAPENNGGVKRASEKIQQMQGNLGINVNPFGRPGGPSGGYRKSSSGGGNSIMTTGDQYMSQNARVIALPGMGAAFPMPGLAKTGMRLPGMQSENSEDGPAPAQEVEHATMSRAAGPKRRGPTRAPPGAVRMPMMGGPILTTEEVATPAPAAVESVAPSETSPSLFSASATPSEPFKPAEPATSSLFGSGSFAPAPEPIAYTPAPVFSAPAPIFSTPEPAPALFTSEPAPALFAPEPVAAPIPSLFGASEPVAAPTPSLFSAPEPVAAPTPSLFGAPEPVLHKAPPAPVAQSSSSLFADSTPSSSLATLSIDETSSQSSSRPGSSNSLFGESSKWNAGSTATSAAPAPAPIFSAPAPAPVYSAPASASLFSAPVAAPALVATPAPNASTSSSLFGAAANVDDSSDSDWSDDEDSKPNPVLFGAPVSAPSVPAPSAAPSAYSAPQLVTPAAPVAYESSSLFGSSAPQAAPPVASAPVAAPAPAPVQSSSSLYGAPAPAAQPYQSLFGADDSSSDSDSEDEGGLFGTGLPTTR